MPYDQNEYQDDDDAWKEEDRAERYRNGGIALQPYPPPKEREPR